MVSQEFVPNTTRLGTPILTAMLIYQVIDLRYVVSTSELMPFLSSPHEIPRCILRFSGST